MRELFVPKGGTNELFTDQCAGLWVARHELQLAPCFHQSDGHVAFNQALVNHPSSPPITDKRPRSNGFIVVGVRPLSKINVRRGRSIWGFGMGRVEEIKWTEVTVDRHEIARRSLRLNRVDMWREVCCGGDNAREIEEIADD